MAFVTKSNIERLWMHILDKISDVTSKVVSYTPTLSEGTEIGTININGEDTTIFAPDTGIYGSHDGNGNVSIFVGQTDEVQMVTPESIGAATVNHTHGNDTITSVDASKITSGTLAIARGGTGQTSIVDTTYTTVRYRASALISTETNPTQNGVINWIYE